MAASASVAAPFAAVRRPPPEHAGERRDEHEGQHHREVFHDEPAHRDAAPLRVDKAALLESPQHHDRACHRKRQAEDETCPERPAEQVGETRPERGHDGDLPDGARHGDGPHGQQVGEGEVQPDAEHEQDDADLGELRRELLVGHVARREGADHHARDEVADERRKPQPLRQGPEHERQAEARHDGRDQGGVMRHRCSSGFGLISACYELLKQDYINHNG